MKRSTWKRERGIGYFDLFRPLSPVVSRYRRNHMRNEELLVKKSKFEESEIEDILNKKMGTLTYNKMKD